MYKSQTEAGIWSKKNINKKKTGDSFELSLKKTSSNLGLDLCDVSNLQ